MSRNPHYWQIRFNDRTAKGKLTARPNLEETFLQSDKTWIPDKGAWETLYFTWDGDDAEDIMTADVIDLDFFISGQIVETWKISNIVKISVKKLEETCFRCGQPISGQAKEEIEIRYKTAQSIPVTTPQSIPLTFSL